MTAFFTVELDEGDAPHRPHRRVRRHREDLHQPGRPAHRGVRHRQGRLRWRCRDRALAVPGGAAGARGARRSAGSTWSCQALDRALEVGPARRTSSWRAMVIADDDRIDGRYLEVHQGILSLLALPGAGRHRPAARRRAAPRDQARRADGRPVREHRQADPARRARAAGRRADARRTSPRMGELARSLVQQASSRSRGATSTWPRTSSARTTRSTRSTASASSARSRSATTPTRASGRCT